MACERPPPTVASRSFGRACALAALAVIAPAARAAPGPESGWLPWIVLGALAVFIVGLVVRMIVASRFPRGYRHWAATRRDAFAERNESWDRDDETFRR